MPENARRHRVARSLYELEAELRKAVIPAEEEFVYGEEHDLSRFPDGEKAPSPRSIASERRLQQLGILG